MNDKRPQPDPVNRLLAALIGAVVLAALTLAALSGNLITDQP